MNSTLQTLWIIAGGLMGWISIEIITAFTKVRFGYIFNIAMTFVGCLTVYTILN